MPNFNDPQYKDLIHQQAQLFNKRSSWIREMVKNEQFPGFRIDKANSKALNRTVDCRDIFSMSSMLPLRGETEEEQKKNLQDDVYKMQQAIFNGPIEEAKKYLNMIFDRVINFDESKLDYSKPEDVFKAISIASMDQCYGTKKLEFYDLYQEYANTPELREKYHFAGITIANYASKTFKEVEKDTHLDIEVTLMKIQFDEYANQNTDNITKRNVEQYQNNLKGIKEVVPLEFVLSPRFAVANDGTKSIRDRSNDDHISTSVNAMLEYQFLAPNTDDGSKVSSSNLSIFDAAFIDGKPLRELIEELPEFNNAKESFGQKGSVLLTQKLIDPKANVEICKLIPKGNGKFDYQYVPVHRDFSHLNPELQREHDEKFNEYKNQDKTAIHTNYDLHMNKKMIVADTYEELQKNFIPHVKDVPQVEEVGTNHPWNNQDNFYNTDAESIRALDKINNAFNVTNRFNAIYATYNPEFTAMKMGVIERRQGNGLAIFLAGPNAKDDNEIFRKRLEIRNSFEADEKTRHSFFKEVVNKYINYKIPDVTELKGDALYEYLAFNYSFSIVTNILEKDKELQEEVAANPEMAQNLALKSLYTLEANEFLADKMIETRGTIAQGIVMQTDLTRQTEASTGSVISITETKRVGFDLIRARFNCESGNGVVSTVRLPYFLSGNPLGHQTGDYSSSYAKYTVDDYLGDLVYEGGSYDVNSVLLSEARIPDLALSVAAGYYNSLANFYSDANGDLNSEIINANKDDKYYHLADAATYIDGKPLSNLIEEKMADYFESNNKTKESLSNGDYTRLHAAYAYAVLAEALTNPNRIISQVVLTPNQDKTISTKVEIIKKDYSAMVKNAANQHGKFASFLHKINLYTYPEEKTARRAEEVYAKINKEEYKASIINKFNEANNTRMLKHQAQYATTREKQLEALKVIDPVKYQEKVNYLNDVRKDFEQEKVNDVVKENTVNGGTSRPTLEKLSKVSQQVTSASKDDSYINRDYKKQVEIPEEELEEPQYKDGYQEENSFLEDAIEFDVDELSNDK